MTVNTSNSQKKTAKKGQKGQQAAKGAGKAKSATMPHELIGMEAKFGEDQICFGFNLGGCDKAGPGAKCPNGWHLCCRPACFSKEHGQRAHT